MISRYPILLTAAHVYIFDREIDNSWVLFKCPVVFVEAFYVENQVVWKTCNMIPSLVGGGFLERRISSF